MKRMVVNSLVLVSVLVSFNMWYKAAGDSGMVIASGFQAYSVSLDMVLRLVLPLLVCGLSLSAYGTPLRNRTIQWQFFALIPRSRHWNRTIISQVAKISLLVFIALFTQVLLFFLLWEGKEFPLLFGLLTPLEQTGRFLVGGMAAWAGVLFFDSIALWLTLFFKGRRFDSSVSLFSLVLLFYFSIYSQDREALSFSGKVYRDFFIQFDLTTMRTTAIAGVAIFIVLTLLVYFASLALYGRMNIIQEDK